MHEFWKLGQKYKYNGKKDIWIMVGSDNTHVHLKCETQPYLYAVPKSVRHIFMYKMSSSVTVARRDL